MRKLLFSVAIATATLATAVPAAAQHQGDRHGRPGWNNNGPNRGQVNELLQDLRRAENQIGRAQQRRMISPREAVSLRREANQIRQRLNFALRGGLSGREFGELRVRVNRLEQRVRIERRDRDRRPG
jgi:Spy/CpxP family protein refolding chaperone